MASALATRSPISFHHLRPAGQIQRPSGKHIRSRSIDRHLRPQRAGIGCGQQLDRRAKFRWRSVRPRCGVRLYQATGCLRDKPVPWTQESRRWWLEELTASDARAILRSLGSYFGQPQGRLTLLSGNPVAYGVTGATSLYYTPYVGQLVPIFDGASWTMHDIGGELSQALSDGAKSPGAAAANSLYDVFVWNDSGTYRISRGPAWTNDSTRSSGLIRIKGILVNAAAIANGPAANRGTYVGTVMTNAAAQVRFTLGSAAAGGGAAELGVWNMYNRVSLRAMVQDTTSNWTYAGTSFRPANNSSNNRVTWVVGLNEDVAEVRYSVMGQASSPEPVLGVSLAYAGIGIDTISAAIGVSTAASISSASTINLIGLAQGAWSGLTGVGKHFVQAMEASPTGSVVSYFGADHMALIFAYRM